MAGVNLDEMSQYVDSSSFDSINANTFKISGNTKKKSGSETLRKEKAFFGESVQQSTGNGPEPWEPQHP